MLVSSFFFYKNYEAIEIEQKARDGVETELTRINSTIEDENQRIAKANKDREALEKECAELDKKHADLIAQNETITGEIATTKTAVEEATKALADLQEKLKGMDDVAALLTQIKKMEEENKRLDQELAVANSTRENLAARREQINKSIEVLSKLEADQAERISPASLKTRIKSTEPQWNFVTLEGGANVGIVLGSKLAVMRGGKKIAELNVNNVEPTKSTADIVPGGEELNAHLVPGDLVVAVRPK